MTTEFSRSLLRVALAQICQNLGWTSVHSTPMELLTDVLERYINGLGVYAHRYSEQFGRVEPTLDDLGLAFQEMGVNLTELHDFVKHVDPVPFAFEVPRYPVRRPNMLNFPKPNSREVYEREEHVPDHMPTMHPGWDEEIMPSGSSVDVGDGDGPVPGDKRPAATPGEDEPAHKKLRPLVLPEEAQPSSYTMKGVLMSDRGLPVGHGKLPEPNAPPPPTPTPTPTNVVRNPLFKTPSVTKETEKPPENVDVSVTKKESEIQISSVRSVKEEPKTEKEPVVKSPEPIVKSPRGPGRPPKSPKVGSSLVQTPKANPDKVPKKRGRPFKDPSKNKLKIPQSPTVKTAKSPGRPPKSPLGKLHKSPGRPPKSPLQSPARSPGRPPKSPSRLTSPRSPVRSPGRSPLSSPLSSPKSPGRGPGRPPKSPGRPPKSPGRVGRPPKSPGRGRPPKSPGRPPLSKKDSPRLPQSPIREYLRTGELPVGEKVLTKAQLKMPMHSPPRSQKPSTKAAKRSDNAMKLDFEKPVKVEPDLPQTVTSETIQVNTFSDKSPPKSEKLKKPTASIDETIAAVLKRGEMEDAEENEVQAAKQREKEDTLRQEIIKKERIEPEKERSEKESSQDDDVRDWIHERAKEVQKQLEEVKSKTASLPYSPLADVKQEKVDSPAPEKEKVEKVEKVKSKKEKKKDREKKKHRDESDSGRAEKISKKERKLEERLREKLRESSPSSSSPERHATSERSKPAPIQPLKIGTLGKTFTFKPMGGESDKDSKKLKKKKKKKEKERERDREKEREREREKERSKEREEGREKHEKHKKDKKRDKEKSKRKEEKDVSQQLKLKFTLGGKGMTVTPTDSPRESPKRDLKLVIKQREESPEKRVFTKVRTPSPSTSPSPTRSLSPPPRKSPTPPPPKPRSPLRLSPVRFTPSPSSNPKTPSMGSPIHLPSPTHSRSLSPSLRRSFDYKPPSSRERSLSPVKTPSLTRATPSPPPRSSLSPSPPPKPMESSQDYLPPIPPSLSASRRGVIAETQGTIIGANGEIIWICPACTLQDDGSPMIGCDVCDDWYHWTCVGITEEPPDEESWYCPKHRSSEPPKKTPAKGAPRGRGRGRGRKKKV